MTANATFEVFQDSADEWRWRLVASNGNIIADSAEGYLRTGFVVVPTVVRSSVIRTAVTVGSCH